MNAGTFNNNPKKTLCPVGYSLALVVHKVATVTQDLGPISFVLRDYYQNVHPVDMDPNLNIQFIEFTYCNDIFSP